MSAKVKVVIDFSKIFHYLCFTTLFAFISFCVNWIADLVISNSQNGKIDLFIMSLHKIKNTGAAFNLLSKNTDIVIALSSIALICIFLFVFFRSDKLNKFSIFSLGLLSGGVVINLYERITQGFVIDYLDFSNLLRNVPIFNASDVMIVLGTFCLIWALLSKK